METCPELEAAAMDKARHDETERAGRRILEDATAD